MKILLVDDEPLARQRTMIQLKQLGDFELTEAQNGQAALDAIALNRPDLIILDIQMPGITGIEVAKTLSKSANPPAIIFATAWDQYAIKAFEVNAIGYLLKPYSKDQLRVAIDKAQALSQMQLAALVKDKKDVALVVAQGNNIERINFDDVYYLQAEDKYTVLYSKQGQRIIEQSLKELEQMYPDYLARIHRSILVHRDKVTKLCKHSDGTHVVYISHVDAPLSVSRRLLKDVKTLLN